jgi:acyl-CoA reductase-like NAD-dependent aldehyde dehydrogenase
MSSTLDVPRYKLFIGGEWVDADRPERFDASNPYSGQAWASLPDAGRRDVDRAVAAARAALEGPWGKMTGTARARLMRRLADVLARDAQELAQYETLGNGKLLRETAGQLEYIPAWFEYFAGVADKLEGEMIPSDRPNFLVYTRHEPVGVVAGIVPWNSPLLLLAWKLAPALAAGCTLVVKPSDSAPVSTLEFARRVEEAGFPAGVFNVVTGKGAELGQQLVGHPGVDKVAFTGSTRVGIEVGKTAIENLTRFVLELGGKSAQLVFEDADLEAAANGVIAGIFAATGQTCIAGSRLLVQRSVHDELLERLAARARTISLGDPLGSDTEMGPLANEAQMARTVRFVEDAVRDGARVVCGGGASASLGGLFFEPTILTGVAPDAEIAQEEVFGPVLAVSAFEDEDEAVRIANGTRYGLAAGVWTTNVHRAHRVAHRLRAGTVWVNCYRVVAPNIPFGGIGASGIGRENGQAAVKEYTETKAIWIELDGATRDPFKMG